MDADMPIPEPEIDNFSLIFPLPYRVAIIIVLGNLVPRREFEISY